MLSSVRIRRCLLFSFAILAVYASPLTVQAQAPEAVDIVRIDTDLVNLSVSIFNPKLRDAPVALQQRDFTILDDGKAQEISFFATNDSPFDLVLLLDLSGSTADKIGLIKKSAKRFVEATRPEDRIAVVTFTADIRTVSKLTLDRAALKKSIDSIDRPSGGTNFWDALRFALEHVTIQSRMEHRRSAVIVLTDGVDNALPDVFGDGSKTTFSELIEVVRRTDSIVLPIYLDTEKESNPQSAPASAYAMARDQLVQLAEESGNLIYQARKVKDLDGVYQQVIRDLGTVYSIGYRPANRGRDGAWHSVSVQIANRPELFVRARRGYYEGKQ